MINFANLFATFKQDLDKTLSEANLCTEFYWFFSVTTDVDGEVTFEGTADNYYQLQSMLQEYVDDEILSDIIIRLSNEGVYISSQYEPTSLIDFSENNNSLEVTYCMLINIVDTN